MGQFRVHERWELFEHGADIGVRGYRATKARAFEQAALALTAVVTDLRRVRTEHTVSIECRARDDELLLAAWLNAVAYEMAVRRMLFGRYKVEIEQGTLHGRASGEPVTTECHEPAVEVKGRPTPCCGWRRRTKADGSRRRWWTCDHGHEQSDRQGDSRWEVPASRRSTSPRCRASSRPVA